MLDCFLVSPVSVLGLGKFTGVFEPQSQVCLSDDIWGPRPPHGTQHRTCHVVGPASMKLSKTTIRYTKKSLKSSEKKDDSRAPTILINIYNVWAFSIRQAIVQYQLDTLQFKSILTRSN